MKLEFKTNKLKKHCENPPEAQKKYGKQIGIKLTQRVNELKAASNLNDIAKMSAINGFHELGGDRKEEFAVTLIHPHRLVFTAKIDDESNLENITYNDMKVLRIEEVIDYHGKNKRK